MLLALPHLDVVRGAHLIQGQIGINNEIGLCIAALDVLPQGRRAIQEIDFHFPPRAFFVSDESAATFSRNMASRDSDVNEGFQSGESSGRKRLDSGTVALLTASTSARFR